MYRVTSKSSCGSQVVTAEERDEVKSRSELFHKNRQFTGTIRAQRLPEDGLSFTRHRFAWLLAAAITVLTCAFAGTPTAHAVDFDSNGVDELTVWRPSNGTWHVKDLSSGFTRTQQPGWQLGLPNDIPVPGYYDGRAELAVWRPSNGTWYVRDPFTGYTRNRQFGLPGDIPVPYDYYTDGSTDFAVWRPSDGTWHVLDAHGVEHSQQWGLPGDIPVPGDYNGDYSADYAVWRPSNGTWYVIDPFTGVKRNPRQWGLPE